MLKKLTITTIIFIFLISSAACNSKKIWKSTPLRQTLQSASYEAGLEPLKTGTDFFNWFRLTVKNNSVEDMEIDWNRTRYLYRGKDEGLFVFGGINPDNVKNATIPGEIIPPGGTFSRDIVPFKLIAFTPLREQSIETEHHNIVAGLIPAGENGIFLVIRQDGKIARSKITVEIENLAVD